MYESEKYINYGVAKWHLYKEFIENKVVCKKIFLALNNIPPADVMPVVRCKDCKNNYHCMIQDFMEDYGIIPNDQNNFFCGYGEREDS